MNDEASRIYGIRSVARQIQSSLKKVYLVTSCSCRCKSLHYFVSAAMVYLCLPKMLLAPILWFLRVRWTMPVLNGRRRCGFWLVPEKNKFSGTNQKPERRQPFGTGLVRYCPQGLFWPFFTFLRAIFFRLFRLSLAPTIFPWVSKDGITPIAKVNIKIWKDLPLQE